MTMREARVTIPIQTLTSKGPEHNVMWMLVIAPLLVFHRAAMQVGVVPAMKRELMRGAWSTNAIQVERHSASMETFPWNTLGSKPGSKTALSVKKVPNSKTTYKALFSKHTQRLQSRVRSTSQT